MVLQTGSSIILWKYCCYSVAEFIRFDISASNNKPDEVITILKNIVLIYELSRTKGHKRYSL